MLLRMYRNFAVNALKQCVVPVSANVRCFAIDANLKTRLDQVVKSNKVVVFMKGVPAAPKCGFSNAVIQVSFILQQLSCYYLQFLLTPTPFRYLDSSHARSSV